MLTFDEVMAALEAVGTEQTRKTYRRHGATDPIFGVKFGDLRPLAKRAGRHQDLATALWAIGNADARLLACMVAQGSIRRTKGKGGVMLRFEGAGREKVGLYKRTLSQLLFSEESN